MDKKTYEIDGANFSTLDGFFEEISKVLLEDDVWGRNYDAFNDVLCGGFGTPEEGYVIRWKNSDISRERLGYDETVRYLQENLKECHPLNREIVRERIEGAKNKKGETVFDTLVGIIRDHCKGGSHESSGVELVLD